MSDILSGSHFDFVPYSQRQSMPEESFTYSDSTGDEATIEENTWHGSLLKRTWISSSSALARQLAEQYTNISESPLANVIYLKVNQPSHDVLEVKFNKLTTKWYEETMVESSMTRSAMNQNYQQIIGMGPAVLPYIFSELQSKGGHWYWALRMITGEDPVPEESRGKVKVMQKLWLDWGRKHKYL